MEEKLSFIVMGDMHYVQPDCHKKAMNGKTGGVIELNDISRNYWMTHNILPDIISEVAAQKPDFVIQTGDLIHGHCDSEAAWMRETKEALNLLGSLNAPVFYAMGTHDGIPGAQGGNSVERLIYPAISRVLGEPVSKGYYKFVKGRTLFIILDYTTFSKDYEQVSFIKESLSESKEYEHAFVFAHPPIIPVVRPFFTNYDFTEVLKKELEKYPVDGYFCGHTHNQIASIHKIGQNWIPQFKSSVLGYIDRKPIMVTDVRPLLPRKSSFKLGWGFLEDSAPGWWAVTVDGLNVTADWHVLKRGVQGQVTWRKNEEPAFTQKPYSLQKKSKEKFDANKIRSARIRIAGSNCRDADLYKMYLNGHLIGYMPRLEYFDCRQFVDIKADMWSYIENKNTLKINTSVDAMCLGGVVLEIETDLGWIRSNVSSYFTNTSRWDAWEVDGLEHIQPGSRIEMELIID